ncbi:MAG: hypothetical protein AAGC95_06365 [Pseudomonadota bacterium]
MTTSELVRQAVLSFDPSVDMEELNTLSMKLAGLAERLENELDCDAEDLAA